MTATAAALAPRFDRPANAAPCEEDLHRAQLWRILSRLLVAPPDAALLSGLAALSGDDGELGRGFAILARAAAAATPAGVAAEYHDLFIGLTRGELLPYGSYYLTGFLNEKPLALLRGALSELGVARRANVKEPEDHIAALCEVMAGLIDGAYGVAQPIATQRQFFEAHIVPWVGRFFADLARAEAAVFFAAVAELGRVFIDIERIAFAMEG